MVCNEVRRNEVEGGITRTSLQSPYNPFKHSYTLPGKNEEGLGQARLGQGPKAQARGTGPGKGLAMDLVHSPRPGGRFDPSRKKTFKEIVALADFHFLVQPAGPRQSLGILCGHNNMNKYINK